MSQTLFGAFCRTAGRYGSNPWLCVPPLPSQDYARQGLEISYGEAREEVDRLQKMYRASGYGLGHRIALALDNRPEHFHHVLALNGLGVSVVPLNSECTAQELGYILSHSEADAIVALSVHQAKLREAVGVMAGRRAELVLTDRSPACFPDAPSSAQAGIVGRATEAAVIYTSGTTGHPKGCLIDNHFVLSVGDWYATMGGCLTLRQASERVYVPLPVFHVNAGINAPAALILTANCLVLPDRFHPTTFWDEVVATRATAMHYLGIIPPLLLKLTQQGNEKRHGLRFGVGAGIDPKLHREFESRFRVPMVEVWGMTETGRFFADAFEPREVDTRAMGRPGRGLQGMVVDEEDREVPRGTPGELVVRWHGEDARNGFFRGYLKDEDATEAAWRGGHFHTGDMVVQSQNGMLYFVDRIKNIIRRSGENISAAEVESALVSCPLVSDIAVMAVSDEIRDEEVMAFVVLKDADGASEAVARRIFGHGRKRASLHKLPGWITFVSEIPRTGTHKIRKEALFSGGRDPRTQPGTFDMRPLKRRVNAVSGQAGLDGNKRRINSTDA